MARRSYAGGVAGVTLTSSVNTLDTSLPVNVLTGVPSGSAGPFAIVVGKGTSNEEKMLASSSGAGVISISIRGYDGSTAKDHDADEEVRMIGTAIDFDEANNHTNKTAGVHGLGATDQVVGVSATQSVVNKVLDGSQNTFSNLPISAMPQIDDKVDDEIADRIAGDDDRYTKTESDQKYPTRIETTTEISDAVTEHVAAVNPHPEYLQDDGTTEARLKVSDLPVYSSDRHGGVPLVEQAATDANPIKTIATISIPAPPSGGLSGQTGGINGRLILITYSVKGFTTNGADGDLARFRMYLDKDGETGSQGINMVGLASGDSPSLQFRQGGNISTAANGVAFAGYHETKDDDAFQINLLLEKVSGSCNPTLVADGGFLQWAQVG